MLKWSSSEVKEIVPLGFFTKSILSQKLGQAGNLPRRYVRVRVHTRRWILLESWIMTTTMSDSLNNMCQIVGDSIFPSLEMSQWQWHITDIFIIGQHICCCHHHSVYHRRQRSASCIPVCTSSCSLSLSLFNWSKTCTGEVEKMWAVNDFRSCKYTERITYVCSLNRRDQELLRRAHLWAKFHWYWWSASESRRRCRHDRY